MQTVILAGGEGTRLRPLTADTPKPLIKAAGETAIERLLRHLRRHGIRSATLCVRFGADKIKNALGQEKCGVRLKYSCEQVPLGTAGCVRRAWNGDDVLVLSGDGVIGFDIGGLLANHKKSGADVSIVVRAVGDPREYGLVTVDEGGVITGFLEKPGYDECLTDLANTGVYVISKGIIERIPDGENVDFARDVFPELLKEGKRMCAFEDGGIWHDIGDIPSLLRCQRELLELEGKDCGLCGADASGSVVSGGSFIEEGAAVGPGSRIIGSLIGENACIGRNADICEAVICKNVTAGPGLIMQRYSALGEGCVVGSGVTVCEGARVAPRTKIPDGAIIRTDILSGSFETLSFGEGGEVKGVFGAAGYLRFGMAAGSALGLKAAAVGGSSEALEAVALGLRAAGTAVFRIENASLGETVFCARRLECSHCVFADGGGLRLISSLRAVLSREEERKTVQAYSRAAEVGSKAAPLTDGASESRMYIERLKKICPREPKINAAIKTDSGREAEIFTEVMPGGDGEKVTFCIASDRTTVSAVCDSGVIPYEVLTVLACMSYFKARKSVILPKHAPLMCDEAARELKSSVIRGATGGRGLTPFSYDPLELICEVTGYLTREGISLSAAVESLPRVVYTKRVIDTPKGLPKLMREGFEGLRAGEDVMLESGGARAFVRPLKDGRAVRMYIESVSQEAAGELAEDIISRLRAKS